MFGPRTRAAIRSWQSSQGARATGYLAGASVAALRPSVAGQPTFRPQGRPGARWAARPRVEPVLTAPSRRRLVARGGRFRPGFRVGVVGRCAASSWRRVPGLRRVSGDGSGGSGASVASVRRTGPAVESMYRFVLWLVPAVEKFPRRQKFLLGTGWRRRPSTCWSGWSRRRTRATAAGWDSPRHIRLALRNCRWLYHRHLMTISWSSRQMRL